MRSLIANYQGAHTFYLDQGFVISAFHFCTRYYTHYFTRVGPVVARGLVSLVKRSDQ